MYQVIYSSVVIWCAILTFLFMGRRLSKLQWFAIFGTSAGLAISSMGNFSLETSVSTEQTGIVITLNSPFIFYLHFFIAKTTLIMFGTLMTIGGTFFYCKKIYTYLFFIYLPTIYYSLRVCIFRLYHVTTKTSTTSS